MLDVFNLQFLAFYFLFVYFYICSGDGFIFLFYY